MCGRSIPEQRILPPQWSLLRNWHQSFWLPRWQLSYTLSWLISTSRTIHTGCWALTTSQMVFLCTKNQILCCLWRTTSSCYTHLLLMTLTIYYFPCNILTVCLVGRLQSRDQMLAALISVLAFLDSLRLHSMSVHCRIMFTHKWSPEVSLKKKLLMWAIYGPRSALDPPVYYQSPVKQLWHQSSINHVNVFTAMLSCYKSSEVAKLWTRGNSEKLDPLLYKGKLTFSSIPGFLPRFVNMRQFCVSSLLL